MPEILRARSRRGLVAALLTVGLVASACGSDASETTAADAETTSAETETTAPETSAAADTDTEPESEATEGEATDTPEPATENLFPDVDVVNIVDGSTVNLAQELGGGNLPVLLWFWAPH